MSDPETCAVTGPGDDSGEARFIAAMRALATGTGARALSDDAAVLDTHGPLVVTHDMMVEGVHWLPSQDAADVAWKLVASNLSDLAAKGARPVALILGYMLGDAAWDAAFAAGLRAVLAAHPAPLLGGDTVAGPSPAATRTLGLTAIGAPVRNPPPARADAQVGDRVWVTGVLGAALAGFEALQRGVDDPALTAAFRRPEPQLATGAALAPVVHAMMDVSDGLLIDARRMAEASRTTIAIDSSAVPVHPALADRRDEAMRWGDDYQLLFTMADGIAPPVGACCIGAVLPAGREPLLIDRGPPDGSIPLGYAHGRDTASKD
ncbi:thiamine-phosphate kinase [Croceicoccus sp. YJ47]|uniref:thiamine-phosphate kinase n=1 Tax=Croceicoccus sp. YJ47 TaxID=2798724 RepID=UPI001F00FF90|nr:thiamine-phosphate kinase [Croceicoccus sp. YJ47]